MSGTIYLIAEDRTDADVVRAILHAHGIAVHVSPLPPTGGGGISRMAKDLERLIETARNKRNPGDCIAVLHDADELVEPRREHYQRIEAICRRHRDDVIHVVAHDEIEAWLLADEGVCRWLETSVNNQDRQRKPSDRLKRLVKRKLKKDYSGPNRAKVWSQLDGTNHSPSLKQALKHLENAPCVE